MKNYSTNREITEINSQQIFTLEKKIQQAEFTIESVGDYIPGNVLVTDLEKLTTVYMNRSGCNILGHSVEELQEQGPDYFTNFFVPDEINKIIQTYLVMQQKQDRNEIFNFAHRVKLKNDSFYKWYFASAKLMYVPGSHISSKILLIVNEVNSLGYVNQKINSVLEESDWMKKNFKKFCNLSRREKELIPLLVMGKNSQEIAALLSISVLTVNTHRRNIFDKLETKNFATLYKFAVSFGLVI